MASVKDEEVSKEEWWFLDSRCNNHMYGNLDSFLDLDESFRTMVTLIDNSSMIVMGRGSV